MATFQLFIFIEKKFLIELLVSHVHHSGSVIYIKYFPRGSVVKNLPTDAGDSGLTPGLGRSPGEGNGNPLQYSCLGKILDKGAWQI